MLEWNGEGAGQVEALAGSTDPQKARMATRLGRTLVIAVPPLEYIGIGLKTCLPDRVISS
jgi:hypothetical protein